MAGTFDISTINVISPNGLVTKAITASDTGYLNVPSPQFADAINLTSGQIKFPATQVPSADANTLDDYEEGGWTPTIDGLTTTGSGTYTFQRGRYIKIGRLVMITADIGWSAHTGTGSMALGSLPFTVSSGGEYLSSVSWGYNNGLSIASTAQFAGYANPSTNNIILSTFTYTGSSGSVQMKTSVGEIILTATYIAGS